VRSWKRSCRISSTRTSKGYSTSFVDVEAFVCVDREAFSLRREARPAIAPGRNACPMQPISCIETAGLRTPPSKFMNDGDDGGGGDDDDDGVDGLGQPS